MTMTIQTSAYEQAGRFMMNLARWNSWVTVQRFGHRWNSNIAPDSSESGPDEFGDALVLLAGQAAVELAQGLPEPDLLAGPVQEAHFTLMTVIADPVSAIESLTELRATAEVVVHNAWPLVVRLADAFEEESFPPALKLAEIVNETLDQLTDTHCCAIAATAVTTLAKGGRVTNIRLDATPSLDDHEPFGRGAWTEFVSRELSAVNSARLSFDLEPEILQLWDEAYEQSVAAIRKRLSDRESLECLAAAWDRHERATDDALGPLPTFLRPELTRQAMRIMQSNWAGKVAAERMTGIMLPADLEDALALRHASTLGCSPTEAVSWLRQARVEAVKLVDRYWPAIVRVHNALRREGRLCEDEILRLVRQAMFPASDEAA